MEKTYFFASLKSLKKEVGSRVGSGSGSLVRGTYPRIRIRIRTKKSRILNTADFAIEKDVVLVI